MGIGTWGSWWRYVRRREDAHNRERAVLDAASQWREDRARKRWREWCWSPPSQTMTVEVRRREWPTIAIWRVADVRPETNVAGLFWREWQGDTLDAGAILELDADGYRATGA